MEEIGEYGRTKNGHIDKYVNIEGKSYKLIVRDNKLTELRWYVEDCGGIVNHSKNIKDLVQAGDVVIYRIKGFEHYNIDIVKEYTKVSTLKTELRVGLYSLEQVEIKQILTKEKFESECYKVKEE